MRKDIFAIGNPFGGGQYPQRDMVHREYEEFEEFDGREKFEEFEEFDGREKFDKHECGYHNDCMKDPCGPHPSEQCPPIFEKPKVKYEHRCFYYDVNHFKPVYKKVINHHIYRHYYKPIYKEKCVDVREDVVCKHPHHDCKPWDKCDKDCGHDGYGIDQGYEGKQEFDDRYWQEEVRDWD